MNEARIKNKLRGLSCLHSLYYFLSFKLLYVFYYKECCQVLLLHKKLACDAEAQV